MSFTVSDFRELMQILEQQPSWRAELRRWVLTEEVLALPQVVHELAEIQRRTEANLDRLTQRIDDLTQRMDQLIDVQRQMETDLGRLKGSDLERRYRERAPAYLSRLIRRPHTLSADELVALIEAAIAQGQLSEDEAHDLFQADVVVHGRQPDEGSDIYLVVEVSWGIGLSDVQRASERAIRLARLGTPTLPVVAGMWVTPEAQQAARALSVWQVTNGRVTSPDTG